MNMKTIGVVGAGMMGRELALCFALAGYAVVMSDATVELAEAAQKAQESLLDREIAKGRLEAAKKDATLANIMPTGSLGDFAPCDLVLEAASETMEVKNGIFSQLDAICGPECILASNTSTFLITRLSAAVSAERRRRFIGMHFFSPALVMKLVEIIPAHACDAAVADACTQLAQSIGKLPVRVKDVTGFAANRMFNILMVEAARLYEEGVASIEDIDTICKSAFGHPVGPFELYDNISLSLNYQVQSELYREYGERFRPRQIVEKKILSGQNGRKAGSGFYSWENNKKGRPLE